MSKMTKTLKERSEELSIMHAELMRDIKAEMVRLVEENGFKDSRGVPKLYITPVKKNQVRYCGTGYIMGVKIDKFVDPFVSCPEIDKTRKPEILLLTKDPDSTLYKDKVFTESFEAHHSRMIALIEYVKRTKYFNTIQEINK